MGWLLNFYTVLSAVAIFLAAGMLLQTYEHARYGRSRVRAPRRNSFLPRVEVLVPCKGLDREFESLFGALLHQNYPSYGVTFIVDSTEDNAWHLLHRLLQKPFPVEARILVSGRARDCGQKIHNLLVGTASLQPATEVLAFADSDVQIEPDWLPRLVERLPKENVGAVTGYRWFVPDEKNWPGAVLSALNASVTMALGNHRWNTLWGGSWVTLRRTFESARIRDSWQGTLSDDYRASKALRRAGLRVAFEPACLVASPVRHTWPSLFEFARRQYLITRVYAPGLWWLALSGELIFNTALWGGLYLITRRLLANEPAGWMTVSVAVLYGLAALRAAVRQSYALFRFPSLHAQLLRTARLDVWAQPLLGLCNLGLILSSGFGRRIRWRGIRYLLDRPQRTIILTE